MRLILVKDYAELSRKASQFLAKRLLVKPDLVLALPTGETPRELYRELVKLYNGGLLDFSQARAFNLDESLGLPPPFDFRSGKGGDSTQGANRASEYRRSSLGSSAPP